jgi:hypothetical protein
MRNDIDPIFMKPGDYGKYQGRWYCITPEGHLGDITNHTIIEHEDGTITVKPSILIKDYNIKNNIIWHGFLECGIWRKI